MSELNGLGKRTQVGQYPPQWRSEPQLYDFPAFDERSVSNMPANLFEPRLGDWIVIVTTLACIAALATWAVVAH